MIVYHDVVYPPAGTTRRLHVYLPRGYHESDERYPVMYMFDGHNLYHDDEATFGWSWGLESFLDAWEKPLIVVGMECCHDGFGRLNEYGPYRETILGHRIEPMGEQTFQWMIDDVKPLVDGLYRTWPHREATGLGGSSMGGIMSLYGVVAHNDVFGKAACLSPGVRRTWRQVLADIGRAHISPDTRAYLSWGEREAGRTPKGGDAATDSAEARAAARVCDELAGLGAAVMTHCERGCQHNEECWRRQNRRYLDFLWRS